MEAHPCPEQFKQGVEVRPVVVLFGWLLAKSRHLHKYGELYHQHGADVITVKLEVMEVKRQYSVHRKRAREQKLGVVLLACGRGESPKYFARACLERINQKLRRSCGFNSAFGKGREWRLSIEFSWTLSWVQSLYKVEMGKFTDWTRISADLEIDRRADEKAILLFPSFSVHPSLSCSFRGLSRDRPFSIY